MRPHPPNVQTGSSSTGSCCSPIGKGGRTRLPTIARVIESTSKCSLRSLSPLRSTNSETDRGGFHLQLAVAPHTSSSRLPSPFRQHCRRRRTKPKADWSGRSSPLVAEQRSFEEAAAAPLAASLPSPGVWHQPDSASSATIIESEQLDVNQVMLDALAKLSPRPAGSRLCSPRRGKQRSQSDTGLLPHVASAQPAPAVLPPPVGFTKGPPSKRHAKLAERAQSTTQVLRVDLSEASCVSSLGEAVCSGLALLDQLDRCAQLLVQAGDFSATPARVWTELGHRPPADAAAGGRVRVQRTPSKTRPLELSACASEEAQQWLHGQAAALRELVRLSLCDVADLQLARKVLVETQGFLVDLERHARDAAVNARDLWREMTGL